MLNLILPCTQHATDSMSDEISEIGDRDRTKSRREVFTINEIFLANNVCACNFHLSKKAFVVPLELHVFR